MINSLQIAEFFLENDGDITLMAFMLDMLIDEIAEEELIHLI